MIDSKGTGTEEGASGDGQRQARGRFAKHLSSPRDAASSVVEPDRARVPRESGRAPPAFSAHTKIQCRWGVRAIAAGARGDARETHLRFFGAGGAARHQEGVVLFRERHARGSGHRRRSARVRRTPGGRRVLEWRLQKRAFPDSYAIQSEIHNTLARPDDSAFSHSIRKVGTNAKKHFKAEKSVINSCRLLAARAAAYASAVALSSPFLFFSASACHMASAPSRLTKPSPTSAGSGCHPIATNARNARKMNARPTTVAA